MTTTEQYAGPKPQVHEYKLRDQSEYIPLDARLPAGDAIWQAMAANGVKGVPVAEIFAGTQQFAIIDVSSAPSNRHPGSYQPFSDEHVVKEATPRSFELDNRAPFVLVHFDSEHRQVVGRALRPGHPVLLGRDAHKIDKKSARFDYRGDGYLSRDHLSIDVDAQKGIIVTDRDSSNGTFVRYGSRFNQAPAPIENARIDAPFQGVEIPKNNDLQLTKEVMGLAEFFPRYEIKSGNRKFFMSDVVHSSRDFAVLYADIEINGRKVVAPRMLYKSRSDGGWRVAYGIEAHGRYVKEAHEDQSHYTQETKLHPSVLDALEQANVIGDSSGQLQDKLKTLFSLSNPATKEASTGSAEIKYYADPEVDNKMKPFRKVSAGWLDTNDLQTLQEAGVNSFTDYFRGLDGAFNALPGFLPDFAGLPEKVVSREHTLLGEIEIEDYHAVLGNKPVIWSMARDKDGRVWIENIRLAGSKVSSYGTYETILDAGLLTNKPLDYASHSDGLIENAEARPFNGEYRDITPLLKQLLPIRQYIAAKSIR